MSAPQYKWPLNDSPFDWFDRLRLAAFVFDPRNRWTMGEQVKAFEREMAAYVGCKHAVFVSSGSTANTLLSMYLSDGTAKSDGRTTVVFPSTTWTTSVAPFVREGFCPYFIDITFADLSLDLNLLETYLIEHHEITAAVFVTSLLGMSPNIDKIQALQARYPAVRFWMDNCESTLSRHSGRNINSFVTSTTSTYYGHLLNSGEGGFVFTNSDLERDYFLMARNHGMTRSVDNPKSYRNADVDPRFDFHMLGSNFRNTDIAAFIGRMDLERANQYAARRRYLYQTFCNTLDSLHFLKFEDSASSQHVMFAIPLIPNPSYSTDEKRLEVKTAIEDYCTEWGIETRPVISGNLLAQRCYRKFGRREDYSVSEYIHRFGMYVGLYPGLDDGCIEGFSSYLNAL